MRILFAADEYPHSFKTIEHVERLGKNTWADITILGMAETPHIERTLETLCKEFLSHLEPAAVPYQTTSRSSANGAGIHKQVRTCIRSGHPAAEILDEARHMEADLIVVGAGEHSRSWQEDGNVPLKVARNAACSVLAIKKNKEIKKVLCCLDHDHITQASLEMVNQMVTLFDAGLEIVVLTHGRNPEKKIEKTLSGLLTYYSDRQIYPLIELVELSSFERFVSQQGRWGLMALWMGKKSILQTVFPDKKVATLLKINPSSVLLLK